MEHTIKVILFDLGRTLLYPRLPWPELLSRADEALYDVLMNAGFTSEHFFTPDEFQACLNNYYDQRNIDQVELTALVVLKNFLISKGYFNIPPEIMRKALDAMYTVTQSNWFIEDDTRATLAELKTAGYRLGLISNAADDWDVQQLIDHWKLRPFFEFILTSAGCGKRKPDPLMFQMALTHFGVQPAQVAMVGDTLAADIAGAERMGFYSIWLTRRAQLPPDGELSIQPQALITSLEELPALLSEIRFDG
jgi:HAD superfamily hydrolase (TIGR01662 family)